MQYRLYDNSNNNTCENIVYNVLKNRNIRDCNRYLNLSERDEIPYTNLKNIQEAVNLFIYHFNNKSQIAVLVDEDIDGFCSAAMMYSYIKKIDCDYPVAYIIHNRAKAHGLSDDIVIPEDISLLIIPDAGTNDVDECKKLKKQGVDLLILDHHQKEVDNPYAVIVNNQISERYENKDLCGAGIVYKFLKALDDETWNEYADNYLDLCAFANISDVMDMRSYETRYLTNIGLKQINNKFLKALINAQEYSMNGLISIHNVQWYLTPVGNALIRIGSHEEKELMFKAFIEQDEFFEYKKRATKNTPAQTIQESIYDRAARLCKNAKSRQDKIRNKGFDDVVELAEFQDKDDKVIMVDVTDNLHEGLTGVVAIKVAEYFNKPAILLKQHVNKEGEMVYGGSARNIDYSPITDFKTVVNSTNVMLGQGHDNAFGIVDLPINEKDNALNLLNEILKDVEYDSTYLVDYILDIDEVDVDLITRLSDFDTIICQGIEEPMIAVENIRLSRNEFDIFGKNEDTISFMHNNIKYVQFKCKEGNQLYDFIQNAWDEHDTVEFNIVGKPCINEYQGIKTPQIIIEDNNLVKLYENDEDELDDDEVW